MKSQLFKTAWTLTKELGMSFSEALKTAWIAFKNDVSVKVNVSWDKVKFPMFTKETSTGRVGGSSIIEVIKRALVQCPVVQTGAQAYYGKGTYNAD